MNRRWRVAALAAAALLVPVALAVPAQADNPIVQTIYTADPAPLVHDGRLYVYTTHDEDGSTWFTMRDWRVFSTTDMANWTDHGSPMSLATFSWAQADAWAGQVVERDGKFFFYVPVVKRGGGQAIGVGVSDSPTGPFRDAIGRPLVDNAEIDPSVMIDDDGQAYLYYGNPNLWVARLNRDMVSLAGSPTRIQLTTAGYGSRPGNVANRPTLYEEGPWVYKRGATYYNVFAGACCSEFIGYSTAPGPTGPWTYRGVVMPAQGTSFTNHPGVIDYRGRSYFFYHSGALPGGGGFTRSVAVEQFAYGADGSIPRMNMTTAGPAQVEPLDPYVTQQAETTAWASGVETEAATEGGLNLAFISNGDWVRVKGVAFGSGAAAFSARVASATSGGRIEVRLDSASGPVVGTCTVPGTGGWQAWTTVTCPVSGATGTRDLVLRFAGGSGELFNVGSWQFTRDGGATPTPTPTPSSSPTPTPSPTTPPSGEVRIVNRASGKVMDVQWPNRDDLAVVGQYASNGQPWQRWQVVDAGGGYGTVRSVHSGKCLDVSGASTADGARLIQYTCHSNANQQFQWRSTGDGYEQLVNRSSGRCVGVVNASTADSAPLEQRTCTSAATMQWSRQR
ncbi:Carbohydrate binding family 6 [Cellulomonas flavigena DSM 20109]|uniref:Carbohydrate binding family 6 n=1 Tax=Cellulomonas flavigena (strain ATCC 482 / DSM 20109 / BCRC 11376 / JCM 18109 / NBRC 3775 / NCIMB 8073 / NRS 134) TaxID=446466 RepID=D5UHU6_CELFN|nr:Carbohydrate binding family 6 [Cellulomonas flavigena DSM 20109]